MIVRFWRARASKERAHLYAEHARSHVFPAIARITGHQGALLLRRDGEAAVDFAVLTFWSSMAAVTAFAGPEPERAVVEPGAEAVLLDFEHTVQHYEIANASGWPAALA